MPLAEYCHYQLKRLILLFPLFLLRRPGLGSSSLPQAIPLGSSDREQGLAVGDFNGDDGPDLAARDVGTGSVTTLLNLTIGTVSLTGFVVPGAGTHNIVASYSGAPYTNPHRSQDGGTPIRT